MIMFLLWILFAFIFLGVAGILAFITTATHKSPWAGVFLAFIAFFVFVASGVIPNIIKNAETEANRAEKFRQDFVNRCAYKHHGRLVNLEAKYSQLSRVCIGPDGRWVEWY